MCDCLTQAGSISICNRTRLEAQNLRGHLNHWPSLLNGAQISENSKRIREVFGGIVIWAPGLYVLEGSISQHKQLHQISIQNNAEIIQILRIYLLAGENYTMSEINVSSLLPATKRRRQPARDLRASRASSETACLPRPTAQNYAANIGKTTGKLESILSPF